MWQVVWSVWLRLCRFGIGEAGKEGDGEEEDEHGKEQEQEVKQAGLEALDDQKHLKQWRECAKEIEWRAGVSFFFIEDRVRCNFVMV